MLKRLATVSRLPTFKAYLIACLFMAFLSCSRLNAFSWATTGIHGLNTPYNFSDEDPNAFADAGHKLFLYNNVLHAVYIEPQTNGTYTLFYARSTNQGIGWSVSSVTSVSGAGTYIRDPSIAVHSGTVYISYAYSNGAGNANRGLMLLKIPSEGLGAKTYTKIIGHDNEFKQTDIAIDNAGVISVVAILNNTLHYYRSINSGSSFGEEYPFNAIALPSGAVQNAIPHISINPGNNEVFVAFDCYNSDQSVGWLQVYKRGSSGAWVRPVSQQSSGVNFYRGTNILVRNSTLYLSYVNDPANGSNDAVWYQAFNASDGAQVHAAVQVGTYVNIYSTVLGFETASSQPNIIYARHNQFNEINRARRNSSGTWTVTYVVDYGWETTSRKAFPHIVPDIVNNQPQMLYLLANSVSSTALPGMYPSYSYINNADSYTYSNTIAVSFPNNSYTDDAVEVRFYIADRYGAAWGNWQAIPQAGSYSTTLTLRANSGRNTIRVQLRDAKGFTSREYAPNVSIVILGPERSPTNESRGWQNNANVGSFSWNVPKSAASIQGYYVYWGKDANGVQEATLQTDRTYSNIVCNDGDGVYYLRVAGKDVKGNIGEWGTVLTYPYDHTAPPAIGATAVVGNWTTVSDWGGMSWSAPADTGGAGIKDYAYYWGADANGTGTAYTTAASYDPPNITGTSNAIYYLRVAARDNALNLGPWKTLYTYRYDAVAPAAPATDPADVWSKTDNPGALSWAAVVDNAGGSGTAGYNYYWGMDETGAPSIWTTGTSYSPGAVNREGSYYLRVQTRDVAGNTSAVKTVRKWSFDKTAPGISTTNTVENWTSENNRAVFGWTPAPDGEGSGIAGYNTRWLYGSTLKASGYSNTNSYDPPECGSGDGLYYLQAQAVDNVGLTGPWTTVLTYQYDGSRPGQTSSAATQNWTNDNDVPETAWLEVADGNGSGVAGYHVYWGLSPTGTDLAYQTDRTYDPVSPNVDGVYYLRVQAVDGVGLTGNWTTVLTYKYDRSKPGISATSIIEGWTSVNSRSVLTWDEAPDDGSGIAGYYMYRGTDPDGESADFLTKRQYDSPPLSGDDRYFFRVQALDNAGNTGNWTTVYSYLYDTTAPDISPTDVTEGWTSINNRSLFSWTDAPDNLSGIAGYYCYWGREPRGISADYVTTAAYDPPLVTSNGVYYLNVQAVDMSGNLGGWTTVLTYRYDGVTPDGSAVISGGKTETRSKVIALFSVASDIGSSVTSMNIGETDALNVWLPFATQYNYELKDTTTGNKTLTIWFADAAGNISAPSVVTINYIGFAGADRAIIVNDDSGYINTINTTLIIDVDTGASEMRLSDDATLSPWLSPASVLPWTFSAGDGEKTVYVEYRDAADYVWGTGVYSGTVTLDTIPPSQGRITINNGDGSVDSTLVELAIAASGEPYTLKLWNVLDAEPADNQYIDYTNALDWTLKFLDGLQTINIRFRDFAGNASEIYSDSIYVDLASGGYSFVFNESDGDNDIASSDFKIRWTDSYRPDPLAEIELSYHEVGGASGVISSNILVTDLVNGLLWDCRGLATGVYYLKAQVSGNRGFFEVTSNYPILVFHDNSLPADPPTVLAVEPLTVITGNTGVTISWQTGAGDAAVSVYYIKRAATTGLDERNVSDRVSLQSRSELNLLTANVTGNSFFWPAADLPSGNYYIYVETGNDYYIHGDFANGYIHVLGHTSGSGGTGEKIWSFPNPFSPANGQEAHIAYQVERDGWTKASVYDIRGRQVWQGENYAYAGRDNIVNWDGRDGRGRLASNGLYILILTNDKNKIIAKGRLALHD